MRWVVRDTCVVNGGLKALRYVWRRASFEVQDDRAGGPGLRSLMVRLSNHERARSDRNVVPCLAFESLRTSGEDGRLAVADHAV